MKTDTDKMKSSDKTLIWLCVIIAVALVMIATTLTYANIRGDEIGSQTAIRKVAVHAKIAYQYERWRTIRIEKIEAPLKATERALRNR